MREPRLPLGGRCGQPLRRDLMQRQRVVQDVGGLGQIVLRRRDHQIERVDGRPRAADQHQAGAPAGLPPNPARHVLVALMRQQDHIGPRRLERVGPLEVDAEQMLAAEQVQRSEPKRRCAMCLTSNGQPIASARASSWVRSPARGEESTHTRGVATAGPNAAGVRPRTAASPSGPAVSRGVRVVAKDRAVMNVLELERYVTADTCSHLPP